MKVTMVKKIMADGRPCQKCSQVMRKLEESGYINRITEFIEARENEPDSPGAQLASILGVNKAPFFIVDRGKEEPEIYTIYFKVGERCF